MITRINNLEELRTVFNNYQGVRVAIDTETDSLSWFSLKLLGFSFSDGTDAYYVNVQDTTAFPTSQTLGLLQEFINRQSLIIGHNLLFDYKVLKKYGVCFYNKEWFDTLIAAHLLNENDHEIGLKALVKKHFGDSYDIKGKEAMASVSLEVLSEYAAKDALYTYKLYEKFRNGLRAEGLEVLFRKIEMLALRAVAEMEMNGFRIDLGRVARVKKELEEHAIRLEEQLYNLLGVRYQLQLDFEGRVSRLVSPVNLNSPQQLIKLFEKEGLAITDKTPKGSPSIGKNTLKKHAEHPFVKLLTQYRIVNKLLTAFFSPLLDKVDADGRIRPSFLSHGTRTGRFSSQNPNLQQLPKERKEFPINTRACFVASDGYKIVTADYSGQELRVLAHVSNDEAMISAFREGRDFHAETAANMGVSRDKAKIFNFSLAYGKGAYGFSKDWGMTEEEAQAMLDKHFAKYPGVLSAITNCHATLDQEGSVRTLFGRKRRFEKLPNGYYPKKAYREAFNFLIQGFSADMMRLALRNLLNLRTRRKDLGIRFLGTVHDEVILEVLEHKVAEAVPLINEAMVTAVKLRVPVLCEVGVGDDYGSAK